MKNWFTICLGIPSQKDLENSPICSVEEQQQQDSDQTLISSYCLVTMKMSVIDMEALS